MIKFLNLYKQDKTILPSFFKELRILLKKNDFILGNKVIEFEKNFSKFCNTKFAIGVANGTDALTIALNSLNLKKGSEVIIPAMTYCSTAFAVINANLKPVLVDIEKDSPTIDITSLKKKINSKTKVIMPVHLYGSVAKMNEINRLIKGKNIFLIDDCSQAHGAAITANKNKKKMIGSIGDISCFSLYPGKNLGAYGDAGIITTNNKKIYNIIKNLRNLGSDKKFIHTRVGVNSRLDTMQAIILDLKLKELKKNNDKRRKIAKIYSDQINNRFVKKLIYSKNAVYHQYVIRTSKRKELIKLFNSNNIQYGFHYPKSINQLDVFRLRFRNERFINSEKLAKEGISLPIDTNLKKNEISKIVKLINSL